MSNNKKIEEMAVRAVEESVEKVDRLESNIPRNDKSPSWDGEIFIHKENDITKKDIIKIPVQVKGRMCERFPKKYSYSIKVNDLKNYLMDGGCILFVVYIDKNNIDTRKIYYAVLTPIGIKEILTEAKGQITKAVELREFPKDNKQKLNIFLNCHSNSQKQYSFIKNKLKKIGELDETGINCIVISSNGMYDAKTAFLNDDYCMYAQITFAGDDILLPITNEKTLYRIVGKDANKKVSIDNKIFYEDYRITEDLKTESAIFGHSFAIRTNKETGITKIEYSDSHNIRELIVDLEFMLEFLKSGYFEIDGEKLAFEQKVVDKIGKQINVEEKKLELNKFKSFVRLLDKAGCKENVDVFSLSEEDYLSFNLLCAFEMGFHIFISNTCSNQCEDIVTINSLQFKIRLKRYNDTKWNTRDNVEYLTKLGVDCAKSTPYVADSITYLGKIK